MTDAARRQTFAFVAVAYVLAIAIVLALWFACFYVAGLGWTLGVKHAWNEPPYAEIVD